MLKMPSKELKRIYKKLNYKGCKNCSFQISPLRTCKWAENGGDGKLHLVCPKWQHK